MGTKKSIEFSYPAFPCGPHQVTQGAVSSRLWFPPGSAHAASEEPGSVASVYELTPSTGGWWVKYSLQRRVSRVPCNNWHKQTGLWPPGLFITSSLYLVWMIVHIMTHGSPTLLQLYTTHQLSPSHTRGCIVDMVCWTGLTLHRLSSTNLHISDHVAPENTN